MVDDGRRQDQGRGLVLAARQHGVEREVLRHLVDRVPVVGQVVAVDRHRGDEAVEPILVHDLVGTRPVQQHLAILPSNARSASDPATGKRFPAAGLNRRTFSCPAGGQDGARRVQAGPPHVILGA